MSHKVINLSHAKEEATVKNNTQKILTLKHQAIINLVFGMMLVVGVALFDFGIIPLDRLSDKAAGILFLGIIIAILGFMIFTAKYKNQPEDELSKELMLKASAKAIYFVILSVALLSTCVMLYEFKTNKNGITVNNTTILELATFLSGVYEVAKNSIFLWLDRTPKDWNEEE